jgi:CheY-like chemotaxis protein
VKPQAISSDTASDAFIRHVAHDLRASLNAVVGWGELVKSGQLEPDDLARAGETIVRHSRQLSQRLNNALDLWRLDIGLLTVSPKASSLAASVRSAVDAARPVYEARGVDCELDVVTDSTVRVDGPRLGQALAILLADVAANTPAGQRIAVTADADPPNARVCVSGSGRLPDVEAFNRSHPEMRASGPARPFDFSLPLARTLVELNGGALDAESSETGGICFVMRLPVAAPAAPVTAAGTRDTTLDGARILVVDDLKDARDIVARLLQPFGAIVTSVPSVDEALVALREAPIDLVVCDIAMPGRDGHDLVREMRGDPTLKDIPAAALTAHTSDHDRRQAAAAGFQEFLPKPVQPSVLVSTLAALFARAGQPE